ncbi:MAG TPA: VIT domain-containing protein [Planctomycetota bacterium]|nr:VIT domain-containing protein [Planctomycetota bacterium]HRR82322.1 VIT domain-containing protein [Planctomycetota bacterium]HRT95448.1 VIT domain-containing protein [Planctomycetota bacterium]
MKATRAAGCVAFVLAVFGLAAQDAAACRVVPSPMPIVRPEMPPRQALETRSHTADITIKGAVAQVAVNAVFYNPNPYVMEGTYFFPLEANASVDNFEMDINGKMVKGELLDADKARGIYEGIVRQMKDPGLLEFMGTKMLKCRVYPMNPNSETKVKLTYSLALRAEGGLYEFTYPFRSARPEAGTIGAVALRVKVEQPDGIKTVYSPSHQVDVKRASDREATLGFEGAKVDPERDFKLYFSTSKNDVGVAVITHKPAGEDGYFLLTVTPSVEEKAGEAQPKSIVFVADTSGSMAGEKIEQAKGALRFCVNSLKPADHFALITFATEPVAFREALIPATKENVQAALEFIDKIEARGGTAIYDALTLALKLIKGAKGLPMIAFMTDGLPTIGETNIEAILKAVAAGNAEKARLFVFGVGYDVNTELLDRLAGDNRGASDYVTPKENIEVKVSNFYAKVANPVLSDLKLEIPGLKTADVYPKALPDLFRGTQLVLLGRFQGGGAKAIKLSGTVAGKPQEFVYETTFAETAENGFLPRLWAVRKVAYLLDEIRLRGKNKELEDEIVKLGKQYGIVTPYTSFLVVEDGARPQLATRLREAGDRLGAEHEGRGAVERAKQLADAKSGAAPAPAGGRQGGGELYGFAADEAKDMELDKAVAKTIVNIGDKTFYRRADGFLVDSLYDEARHKDKLIEVKPFSDEYFALVNKHPSVGRYLAEKEAVIIVIEGQAYKIAKPI